MGWRTRIDFSFLFPFGFFEVVRSPCTDLLRTVLNTNRRSTFSINWSHCPAVAPGPLAKLLRKTVNRSKTVQNPELVLLPPRYGQYYIVLIPLFS